jgi:REP element-mobilizing transposase RayT
MSPFKNQELAMPDEHPQPNRRSIRLRNYDYRTSNAYFVTICTLNRECLFGDVADGVMCLNAWGQIAEQEWTRSGEMRPAITLDEFVVMPNH